MDPDAYLGGAETLAYKVVRALEAGDAEKADRFVRRIAEMPFDTPSRSAWRSIRVWTPVLCWDRADASIRARVRYVWACLDAAESFSLALVAQIEAAELDEDLPSGPPG